MKNIYNFNVDVETPQKSIQEEKLFLKWKPILKRMQISQKLIEKYKKDLLTLKLIMLLLFTTLSFSQSVIVPAGTKDFTLGEVFPLMQQLDTIEKEVSLGVPSFEVPVPPKKEPIKKKSLFQKILEAIRNLFK